MREKKKLEKKIFTFSELGTKSYSLDSIGLSATQAFKLPSHMKTSVKPSPCLMRRTREYWHFESSESTGRAGQV